MDGRGRIIGGDCLGVLKTLPAESVNCCVTSPPYWGLRDYGVDGQIGIEETPEAYVARLVGVFREVRRVLRDDGTLWLNLGDSYAGSGKGAWDRTDVQKEVYVPKPGGREASMPKVPPGLKPKDLVGIPWRVAFALQQPYYTGRIKSETDRTWLAAMIDGEGCMFIHKRGAGLSNGQGYTRKNASYGAGLEVANCNEAVIRRCAEITGLGSICHQDGGRRQRIYRWSLRSNACRDVIHEIYPHLVGKKHEARLLIGCPSSGEVAAATHEALKGLHNGIPTTIDFPAPAAMFEPGFYLRQDIIWSKLNPMPESVRDRCTKAHEYLFLLSKSPRYFYDHEAIKEAATCAGANAERKHAGEMEQAVSPELFRTRPHGRTCGYPDTRNRRTVWTVATKPYPGAHFATFPPDLIRPCVRAGCPVGGVVLDPFAGAGTTGLVALEEGRNFIGIELNPDYCKMAEKRIVGLAMVRPLSTFFEGGADERQANEA